MAGVCVADSVVLPLARPVEIAVDVPMPEELGALTIERAWIGEGQGLFGAGWSSVWDVRLVDGAFDGLLPARPVEPPRRNQRVELAGGASVRVDNQGRLDEVCLDAAVCTGAEWSDDALVLRPMLAEPAAGSADEPPEVTLTLDGGLVTAAAASDGRSVEYRYVSNALSDVFRGDNRTTYTYQGSELASVDDGIRRTYSYDRFGQVVGATDIDGGEWTIRDLDASTSGATSADAPTRTFEVESPDGWTRTYRFTSGQLVAVVDLDDGVLLRRELRGGRLQLEERPMEGLRSEWLTANELQVEQSTEDGPGRRVRYWFDDERRLVKVQTVDGSTEISYAGLSDRPVEVNGPDGTRTLEYDDSGLLVAAEDADGYRVEVERGPLGQVVVLSDGVLRSEFGYDVAGRVVEERSGGSRTQASYLANGLLESISFPSGESVDATYDEFDRLQRLGSSVIDDGPARLASDADDDLTAVETAVRPDGRTEQRFASGAVAVLDAAGRPVEVTVDGRTETRVYDDAGRLIELARPGGPTYELTYTAAGRLATVDDGTLTATFSWHGDLLIQVQTSAGSRYSYSYDEAGRVVTATSGPLRWDYEYDELGRSSVVRGPSGVLRSQWDERGRPLNLRDGLRLERYEWDGGGFDLKQVDSDGELVLKLERDDSGRVVKVAGADAADADLTFDAATGALIRYRIGGSAEVELSYRDGQVVGVASGDRTEAWRWADGNVIEVAVDGVEDPYRLEWLAPGMLGGVLQGDQRILGSKVDDAGRPTEFSVRGEVAATVRWDGGGFAGITLTDGPTATLQRDVERRIVRVQADDRGVDWTYDDGALTRVSDGDRSTDFDYDAGRLNRTTHTVGDVEASIFWDSSGARPARIVTPDGEVGFTYGDGTVRTIQVSDGEQQVRYEEGRPIAEGKAGEFIEALFDAAGRYLTPAGKTTVGPSAPWIEALPDEFGAALPEVLTARSVAEVAINEQLPDLPGFLLDDPDGLAQRSALGLAAVAASTSVATGPDRVAPLGLQISTRDSSLDLGGEVGVDAALRAIEILAPNPGLVRQALNFGQSLLSGVSGGIATGFGAVQVFLTDNALGRFVLAATFIAATALVVVLCKASVVCAVAGLGVALALEGVLTAGPDQSVVASVASALLAPFGDLLPAIQSGNALAIALTGATAVATVATVAVPSARALKQPARVAVCNLRAVVCVSRSRFGDAAQHVADAQRNGAARMLRVDRTGASARRDGALRHHPARAGFDRDEYPPALSSIRKGLSVRYVDPSANRALGAYLERQLRGRADGSWFWVLPVA